ncbi:hypothetical protein QCA50_005082 [Cerrena zonata]|uniref:Uncharacterized protein n=1 Tax=Cerrena zonata TaxID=2478898 RepID=A0AAW0GN79_9APHY
MGVHGLTTYLRENRAVIARSLYFQNEGLSSSSNIPFVIDGWSFIYEVHGLSNLPWVYGGEYRELSRLIELTVRAWISVGLRVYFVFDGPYPSIKFPTLISRITKNSIQGSKLFFVTSAVARSRPRFLHEIAILPPRAYAACVESLKSIIESLEDKSRLELHFADEEGDPYTVELAGRLGGYAVGQDSDFVVLNAEGYKGYVPMSEMVWTALNQIEEVQGPAGDDGGFQTVVNSKTKKKALAQKPTLGIGIIPPEETDDIRLSVSVYSPEAVASHLRIPVALLPLMGALVGNDFTGSKDSSSPTTSQERNLQWLFFERQLTLSQRITRVANTLHDILTQALTPSAKGKHKLQVSSVMQLIERAVSVLLVRSADTMASGQRERIMDRIVEATLQYAIPRHEGTLPGIQGLWASSVCALHDDDTCPLFRYLSPPILTGSSPHSHDSPRMQKYKDDVRTLYISAYRAGRLAPRLLDVMNTGTFWYRQTLENPDIETASASFARPIQEFCYALMDDGLGLPEQPAEEEEDDEDDEDELIDVVEESDEDYLAPLRGALQELDTPADSDDEMATEPPASVSSLPQRSHASKPKVVEEYLRRGVRLANEKVPVPSLTELLTSYSLNRRGDLPIQLTSEEDRVTLFLQFLQSDVPCSQKSISRGYPGCG